MTETIAFLDFETTGKYPDHGDRPTEVAVVFVRSQQIVDRFERLMNPGIPIPANVQKLTGIRDQMVRNKPSVSSVMAELASKIRGVPIVAHYSSFERKFFKSEFGRLGYREPKEVYCTCRIAKRVYPDSENYKLGTLVKHAGLIFDGPAHRAMPDAEMTARLWIEMEKKIQDEYHLDAVPLELMARLQSISIYKTPNYLARYAERLSKAKPTAKKPRRTSKATVASPKDMTRAKSMTEMAPEERRPIKAAKSRMPTDAATPKRSSRPRKIPDYLLPENVCRSDKRRPTLTLERRAKVRTRDRNKQKVTNTSNTRSEEPSPAMSLRCISCGATVPVQTAASFPWEKCASCGTFSPKPLRARTQH